MRTNPKLAAKLINEYNRMAKELNLSANEFLVYCAVVHCCQSAASIKGTVGPIVMREIQTNLAMSRETVRRTLHGLEEKGLVTRIEGKWFYA